MSEENNGEQTTPETNTPVVPTPETEEPKLPKGAVTTEQSNEPAPEAPATPVVASVAERLGAETAKEVAVDEAKPTANTPQMIDLANMTSEQAAQLKSILSATPDQVQKKRGNLIVEIRRMMISGEWKYIVDFKNSRLALAYHPETAQEYETHKIQVLFAGDTEYTDLMYTDFMDLDRVKVEIMSQRQDKDIIEEGQVVSRETGQVVTKEVTTVIYYYTIKLPNGETVEIEGKIANA